jgi:2-C-methyl-D-erythritol 4-phosphate cytidylyltransferase
MGTDIPKQFLPVGGKPVLMRTIERFQAYSESEMAAGRQGLSIILVLPKA